MQESGIGSARAVERLDAVGLTKRTALLKEPMMRCDPLCRIQFPDQSVLRPVSMTNTASRLARSLTGPHPT